MSLLPIPINVVMFLLIILKIKASLGANRGNLTYMSLRGAKRRGNPLEKNAFLFLRLLHSVRNYIFHFVITGN
jgi:hypothetical protein